MRVAIVQEHADPRRGGAETSTLEMARHLAGAGLDVTVVSAAVEDGRPAEPFEAGDSLRFMPLSARGRSKYDRTVSFVEAAGAHCADGAYDVVHAVTPCHGCHVYQPRGGTYRETIQRTLARVRSPVLRGIKRIGRRLNRRQQWLRGAEERLLLGDDPPVVAAVSAYVAKQVRRLAPGLPREHIQIVYNGVDVAPLHARERQRARRRLREALGFHEDEPLVLFLAHNFALKGLRELLEACALSRALVSKSGARDWEWSLVVAGRDHAGPWQRLARRLGVSDRVHFVGAQPDSVGLFAMADLLAHPTWYDPCSRVVLEALALGVPVVTTHCNGAAEVIDPQRHGDVIDTPRNTEALAAGIARCLDPLMQDRSRAAAPLMHERLSMARHARELRALYERVVASRSAGARPEPAGISARSGSVSR